MENEDRDFFLLQKKIFENRGFDFQYNPRFLKRRFAVRMRARAVTSYSDYAKLLNKDPNEYKALFDTLTINITQFFRDSSVYEAFEKQVLPVLISAKLCANRNRIRIWSAGCASGEEPYSIAMLLNEILKDKMKDFIISILGTDIDNNSLNKAKEGIYTLKNIGEIKKEYLAKYFTPLEKDYPVRNKFSSPCSHIDDREAEDSVSEFTYIKDRYIVNDEIKKIVRFSHHNFISDEPYTNFDVIFCRNVLIYLTPQMRTKLLKIFYSCLNKNGYLIIGRSEALFEKEKLFCLLNPEERIFCKANIT